MALLIILGLALLAISITALWFAAKLRQAKSFMQFFGSQAAVDRKMRELGQNCFEAFCYMQRAKNLDERKSRSREFICHRDIFEYALQLAWSQKRGTLYTWEKYLTVDQQRVLRSLPQ